MTRPLPLVFPKPSISRAEMRLALNRARMPFRSACVCHAVNGLIAAGIGISAMAASLVPPQLTMLGPHTGCPTSARSALSCSPIRELNRSGRYAR